MRNCANSFKNHDFQLAIATALIILVGALLRLFRLDFQSFWFDEAFTGLTTQMDWAQFWQVIRGDVHPPLYYLLIRCWSFLFGAGDFALRSFSVLCSAFVPAVAALLAVEVKRKEAALPAALLLAVSPFQIAYAQEARSYALLTLLTTISFWLLLRLRRAPNFTTALALGCVNALLLYTHYHAIFIYLVQALWIFGGWALNSKERSQRVAAGYFSLASLFTLATFAPWLPIFLKQLQAVQANYWIAKPALVALPQALLEILIYRLRFNWALFAIFFTLLILAWFAVQRWHARRRVAREACSVPDVKDSQTGSAQVSGNSLILLWLLFPPCAIWLQSQVSASTFIPRILAFCAPAAFLLSAEFILKIKNQLLVALLFSAAISALTCNLPWYFARQHKDNWKAAAEFLRPRLAPQDELRFEAAGTQICLKRYLNFSDAQLVSEARQGQAAKLWLVRAMTGLKLSQLTVELDQRGYRCRLVKRTLGIDIASCALVTN